MKQLFWVAIDYFSNTRIIMLFFLNIFIIVVLLADCRIYLLYTFIVEILLYIRLKLLPLRGFNIYGSLPLDRSKLITSSALIWEAPHMTVLNNTYRVVDNSSVNSYISFLLIFIKSLVWLAISYYFKIDFLFITYLKDILGYSIVLDLILILLVKRLPIFYILFWFLTIGVSFLIFFKVIDMPLSLSNKLSLFIQSFYSAKSVPTTDGLPDLLLKLTHERDDALTIIRTQSEIISDLNNAVNIGNAALLAKEQFLKAAAPTTATIASNVSMGVLSFFANNSWIITGGVIIFISIVSVKTITLLTGAMPGILMNKIIYSTGLSRFMPSASAPAPSMDEASLKKSLSDSLSASVKEHVDKALKISEATTKLRLDKSDAFAKERFEFLDAGAVEFQKTSTDLFAKEAVNLNSQLADFMSQNSLLIKESLGAGSAVVAGLQMTNSVLAGRIAGVETLVKGRGVREVSALQENLPTMADLLATKTVLENQVAALTLRVTEINSNVNELNALLIHTLKAIASAGGEAVAPVIPAAAQAVEAISSLL